jgi:hypothetical protein
MVAVGCAGVGGGVMVAVGCAAVGAGVMVAAGCAVCPQAVTRSEKGELKQIPGSQTALQASAIA